MPSPRDFRMLMHHGAWANSKLFSTLADVPAQIVESPRPGRHGGLIGTLAHIHVVDKIWQAHLLGTDHGFKTRNLDQSPPLAELHAAQTLLDQWYIAHADGLSESQLTELVHFRYVDGGPGLLTRGDILLHVANHKTYHRGYIADMLYESGMRPPTMDLPVFLRDVWSSVDFPSTHRN